MKAKAIFLSLLMIGIGAYGCGNETATSSLATQAQKLAGESDAAFTSAGGSLAEKLGLTQDQEEAIAAIREEQGAAIKALIEEAKAAGSDRESFREQKQALGDQLHEEILGILNDEQKALFEEMKSARHDRARGKRGKRARGAGDISEKLGLTADQQEQMTALKEDR